MKKTNNPTRIYQPNLTCRFHLFQTPDLRFRNLVMINKDEGVGICDEQIILSYWEWAKQFMEKLKRANTKIPEELPPAQLLLSFQHDFSGITLLAFVNEGLKIFDYPYGIIIQNFCYAVNKQSGFNIKEIENNQESTSG